MAKSIILRFTEVTTPDGKKAWDSNRVVINGAAGVHIETNKSGSSVNMFRSMTGINMVTCHQDYFGDVCDFFLPYPGIGYTCIFRLNYQPVSGLILGENVEDAGDVDPTDSNAIPEAFAGKEGVYFVGSDGQYFVGKTLV
jgi:hypothetical protein